MRQWAMERFFSLIIDDFALPFDECSFDECEISLLIRSITDSAGATKINKISWRSWNVVCVWKNESLNFKVLESHDIVQCYVNFELYWIALHRKKKKQISASLCVTSSKRAQISLNLDLLISGFLIFSSNAKIHCPRHVICPVKAKNIWLHAKRCKQSFLSVKFVNWRERLLEIHNTSASMRKQKHSLRMSWALNW